MAAIVYGTHVFTKAKGYYGTAKECPGCKKTYKPAYVRYTTWAHLEYIPLFPIKSVYAVLCPICGQEVDFLKSKEAKAQMQDTKDESQKIDVYAKRVITRKPINYDLCVRDLNTNTGIKESL